MKLFFGVNLGCASRLRIIQLALHDEAQGRPSSRTAAPAVNGRLHALHGENAQLPFYNLRLVLVGVSLQQVQQVQQ